MSGSTLSRRVSEFIGVALFATALIWLIALATYNPADPVWFFNTGGEAPPTNFAGRVGAFLAELSYQVLGYAAYLTPMALCVIGWHYFWCSAVDAPYTKLFGVGLLFSCLASFLSLAFGSLDIGGKEFRAGGYAGDWLASLLAEYLNRTGSIILILTMLFLAIILSTQFSFGRAFGLVSEHVRDWSARLAGAVREWRDERRREKQRREVIRKHLEKGGAAAVPPAPMLGKLAATVVPKPAGALPARERGAAPPPESPKPAATGITPPPAIRRDRAAPSTPLLPLPEPTPKAPAERRKGAFTPPPLALLDAPRSERKIDERELMDGARLLEEKCREFAVEGTVVQIHPGPVVTTYEFKPDAGVKYSKITSLADDLCLAMQAESVLIERLPGRSTVGIQIPNQVREQISLRELLESEVYRRSGAKLTLALGKTIHGEPFVSDLSMMPHLLIAGSTGAGKSVAINAMITSILYRATPDEVRFIMIDPKRLELGMYEDIPHLLTPVVVDPKLASNALRWAVQEMEERYKKLAAEGVRNIDQYNRNVRQMLESEKKKGSSSAETKDVIKPLPFIVVVIDELADLMMTASIEVEESIARLAQMARAVGIHLILATQRPSVDVITGLIKANIPSRLAFAVSSQVDSRTILDSNGAEKLLGRGDMLFLPLGASRAIRAQGAYIADDEIRAVVEWWRRQGAPSYDQQLVEAQRAAPTDGGGDGERLVEAARLVVRSGYGSVSLLQRKMRIGYVTAARLIDELEARGIVGPVQGSNPREVLIGLGDLDSLLRARPTTKKE